jgi:hypothetical protein
MQIRVVPASNVFLQNDCIVFDRARATQLVDSVPDIAALSVICREEQLPRDLALMDKACVEHAVSLLFGNTAFDKRYRVWLFLCHGPSQPRSVMVKHKGLWASFPIKWKLNMLCRSDEIVFESKDGLRYAGVAQIGADSLFTATQLLRANPSCALIISKRLDVSSENGINALFKSAFPLRREVAASRVDWLHLSLNLCPVGDILGSVTGSWDEREAAFNLIMRRDTLPLFDRR